MGMNGFAKPDKPRTGSNENALVRLHYEEDGLLSQLRTRDESAGFLLK
jgi:hypothetical protein